MLVEDDLFDRLGGSAVVHEQVGFVRDLPDSAAGKVFDSLAAGLQYSLLCRPIAKRSWSRTLRWANAHCCSKSAGSASMQKKRDSLGLPFAVP